MAYRKYKFTVLGLLFIAFAMGACTSTGVRKPSSINNEMERHRGREPAALKGNFTWLDQVEEDFGRIAAETSSRTVASEQSKKTYIKKKNWWFAYSEKNNSFYANINGQNYKMVQTSISDGESFAFTAEGQTENPVTLSILHKAGRKVASNGSCNAELSYWNTHKHAYVKENTKLKGKSCAQLITKLKDYVP